MTTEFVTAADAASMDGLRLVVTRGIPGPWSESAKGILRFKGINHMLVSQIGGDENRDLVEWTGMNSAPIAVLDSEPPRSGWNEILLLAERLQPDPPLIPGDELDRAAMFGLAHELCAEDGYGWNRRLLFFADWDAMIAHGQDPVGKDAYSRMHRKYGYGRDVAQARKRIIDILRLLSDTLLDQGSRGSRYYIGKQLTAVDIYSACFMAMVKPLPIEMCPTSPAMHAAYHERNADVLAATDTVLFEHRDYIYQRYLELPLRL